MAFIDEGKLILHEDVEELKSQYSIYTVSSDKIELLEVHNPKLITKTLGHVSAVLKSDIIIEEAEISKPSLSDLFLEKVGGSHE